MPFDILHLTAHDVSQLQALAAAFGEAFEDPETSGAKLPSADYLQQLLANDTFIALAAVKQGEVVGGIVAYELKKFEQARSEIYIYDLAVKSGHRRGGIATAMIHRLKGIAAERGADMIYVQANTGVEDERRSHFTANSAPAKRSYTSIFR